MTTATPILQPRPRQRPLRTLRPKQAPARLRTPACGRGVNARLDVDLPDALLDALADAVAARLAGRLDAGTESPWRTTKQAIEYTRLPEGTFRKLAASGRIPSHGGRTKLFHIAELDRALGYVGPVRPRGAGDAA